MSKIIVQFNEANFDLIKKYCFKYNLKNIKEYLNSNNEILSTSEDKYENLEPWIQWYSFYSNKDFKNHKVFHLNHQTNMKHENFLSKLAKTIKIGIYASMNLPFDKCYQVFIPDPWSSASSDNSFNSKLISSAITQLVNTNSRMKISLGSIMGILLLIGFPKNLGDLKNIVKTVFIFFKRDRSLLASYFDYYFFKYALGRHESLKLDLSTIFLNGFAHIQHHYMLNSEFINGENPDWYCSKKIDPIKRSLEVYEKIFEKINIFNRNKDNSAYLITGLTQSPFKNPVYYWRFINHKNILSKFLNIDFKIKPLMTRDFQIYLKDEQDQTLLLDFLNSAKVIKKDKEYKAFDHIDILDKKIFFATFIFDKDINDTILSWNNQFVKLSKKNLDFVAIKNAGHNSKGWAYGNFSKHFKETAIWNLSKLIY